MVSPDSNPRPILAAYLHQFVTYGFRQALRMDLFPTLDHLGQANTTDLAAAMGVTPGMLADLLDMLALSGVLEKITTPTPAEYRLSPSAQVYLSGRDPGLSLSGFDLLQNETWDILMAQGDAVLRTGLPARRSAPTSRERWISVVPSIAPIGLQQGPLLIERIAHDQAAHGQPGDPYELLEAGCGVGRLAVMILRARPTVHITGADFPVVLELATAEMQQAGLQERFTPLALDLTQEAPHSPRGPYAACVASMFCQVLSESQLHAFFRLAGETIRPGGRLWILDCVPDDARQAPDRWEEIVFSYMMAFIGGRSYTAADYRRMLEASGWTDVTLTPTDGIVSLVQARRR